MSSVWSSTRLLEFDFSAIESVLTGWFMRSPGYIRIAKLGVHAYVASHVLGRPADLTWSDADLGKYFKAIKKSERVDEALAYQRSKRVTHGTNYGLTTFGMCRNYPTVFPTVKSAEAVQEVYFAVAPELPTFQTTVRHTAHTQHYLGGAATYTYDPDRLSVVGHPYGYKHWFWSVVAYERLNASQILWRRKRKMPLIEIGEITYGVTLGEDAKRCSAFYAQSTARGVLTDACFPLFDPEDPWADRCYIGDLYYGQTPLRAPIHDSLLLEVPTRKVDRLIERTALAMQRPIEAMPCPPEWGQGAYLTVGVDAKMGEDWGHMVSLEIPSLTDLGVANDTVWTPAEVDEEDEVLDLGTKIA